MDLQGQLRQLALLAIDRTHHCEARQYSHILVATRWRRAAVALSVVTAFLATSSGLTVPVSSDVLTATLSLSAGVIGAITAALTPAPRAAKHAAAAVAYRTLRTRLVDFLSLDIYATDTELIELTSEAEFRRLRDEYHRYSEETNTLDSASPDVIVRPKFNPRDREHYHGENAWWKSQDALKLKEDETSASRMS